ncbi:DUF6931 family protein [Plastoroseomonas arctica]|uniref:Uncharacterized protein n=1 Tax=Plastoroseomonas arctica TaxID=1509237 RepID=A0AAF1KME9_9PROT|nr:hypothetical protein [Plastoroseomonas arctica]MBR0656291.1 hypothetical protein [Plastoroseomonas arctica]
MSQTLPKLSVPLPPILARLELEPESEEALAGAQDALQGIEQLVEAGKLVEAARLVAHALPKREAVWWACMCARAVPDPALKPEDLASLAAAEAWVRRPEERARRAAAEIAEKTSFKSAEAWAAMGAFWSGGSLAPEGMADVPPGEHLTGVAVAGAIVLASVRVAVERQDERLLKFLDSARAIAAGGSGRIEPEEP